MAEREVVDLVNAEDGILGEATLDQCYSEGLLHRAVTVYCWNSVGQVVLQRRSFADDWFPGFWTASCTGHVKKGESWREAATRELYEELGLQSIELSLLFKYIVPPIRYNNLTEYEMMYVVETDIGESKITIDRSEVEEVRLFTRGEFKHFFETNLDSITPDAIESYQRYVNVKEIEKTGDS